MLNTMDCLPPATPAAGAASSATRSTSLSGGAPAPVAPPLSAPSAMTQASAASVEAFKQQALADRARAQAQIQQEYERVHASAVISEKRGRNFDKVTT